LLEAVSSANRRIFPVCKARGVAARTRKKVLADVVAPKYAGSSELMVNKGQRRGEKTSKVVLFERWKDPKLFTVTAGTTVQRAANAVRLAPPTSAGKSRKPLTDALGRLVQVVEDPSGLNLQNQTYTYKRRRHSIERCSTDGGGDSRILLSPCRAPTIARSRLANRLCIYSGGPGPTAHPRTGPAPCFFATLTRPYHSRKKDGKTNAEARSIDVVRFPGYPSDRQSRIE